MQTKGRGKLFLFSSLGILLVVVLVAGTGAFSKRKPVPPEKLIKPERGDIARSVVARGKIEPLSKVEVKSKANGIVQELLVDVGDTVKEGQILAELDKEDLQAQVRRRRGRPADGAPRAEPRLEAAS